MPHILDASGTPFPPHLTARAIDVEIDGNGNPRRADGRAILEAHPEAKPFEYPTEDRLDAAASWFGGLQGGQGWPGYRGATFQNSSTGVGTPRDKTTFGAYWAPWRLSDPELLAMYNGSDIGAKIVDAPIDEMFRNGWEVGSRDLDTDSLRTLDDKASKLRVTELLNEGAGWGRLFGGALNIIGAEDGRNPDEELNEQGIKALHYLNVVDRRFIWVQRYYSDMLSPKYGLPEIYLITNVVSHGGMYGTTNPPPGTRLAAVSIHESRCIRFDGAKTDVLTRQQLAGWTWSVLQRCYDVLRRFDGAFDSVGNLLSDASQAVFKIKNLVDMIAQNQKSQVVSRMQLADFSRSALRAIMVDADNEDFERKPTSFAGIPELLDRYMMRVAAAAGAAGAPMPVTLLFGRSAAGLNATGDADERMWLSGIRSKQTNELGPKIKRIYRLMSLAKDSKVKKSKDSDNPQPEFQVKFRPLWDPTEKELTERSYQLAQRNQILIETGQATPEQCALGMFGSGELSDWIDVDVDKLQESIDGAVKFDPYEKQPAPEGSNVNAEQQGEMQSPVVPLPLPGAPDIAGSERQKEAESPQRTTDKPQLGPDGEPLLTINVHGAGARPSGAQRPTVSKQAMTAPDKDEDGNPIPRKPRKDEALKRLDSSAIATAVHAQMAQDYEPELLDWVLSAHWRGPKRVSLDKIDFENQDKWQATHDPVHVATMKSRIESGIERPIILVKIPSSKKLIVVDGHHRSTAYQQLDKNPKAYIAEVTTDHGPWDNLHTMQREGVLGSDQKKGE